MNFTLATALQEQRKPPSAPPAPVQPKLQPQTPPSFWTNAASNPVAAPLEEIVKTATPSLAAGLATGVATQPFRNIASSMAKAAHRGQSPTITAQTQTLFKKGGVSRFYAGFGTTTPPDTVKRTIMAGSYGQIKDELAQKGAPDLAASILAVVLISLADTLIMVRPETKSDMGCQNYNALSPSARKKVLSRAVPGQAFRDITSNAGAFTAGTYIFESLSKENQTPMAKFFATLAGSLPAQFISTMGDICRLNTVHSKGNPQPIMDTAKQAISSGQYASSVMTRAIRIPIAMATFLTVKLYLETMISSNAKHQSSTEQPAPRPHQNSAKRNALPKQPFEVCDSLSKSNPRKAPEIDPFVLTAVAEPKAPKDPSVLYS